MMTTDDGRASFARFVRLHEPRLRAFVRRRVASETLADDIVQDTFLVAWRRYDHLLNEVPVASEFGWLCSVALRVWGHELRSLGRRERLEVRHAAEHGVRAQRGFDQADGLTTVEQRDVVERALAALRDDDRQILLAVLWDGFTAEDIAALLGCSQTTARKRISRAVQRLRRVSGQVVAT